METPSFEIDVFYYTAKLFESKGKKVHLRLRGTMEDLSRRENLVEGITAYNAGRVEENTSHP